MKYKNIIYGLIIVIVIGVCGYTIYKHFNNDVPEEVFPFSYYSDIIEDDDYYVINGFNNYYNEENAKYNSDNDIIIQGEIIKLDKNLNIIKKVNYLEDGGILSLDILKTNDGYILTGYVLNELTPKSIVIKVDKDLNIVKKEILNELSSTVVLQLVQDDDKYIVLCQTFDRDDNEIITDKYNVIYKFDSDLNIIDQFSYKEKHDLLQLFVLDDSYLFVGDNENNSSVVTISKDDNKVISTKTVNIPNRDKVYLYDDKLYTSIIVYDLKNDKLSKINSDDLLKDTILLIDNDIIYTSHSECGEDECLESIRTYDMDFNIIKEYKTSFETVSKIINYDDKLLVIGRIVKGDSIKSDIKFIEK